MNGQMEERYRFCSRCGALMDRGVCPECALRTGMRPPSFRAGGAQGPAPSLSQTDGGWGESKKKKRRLGPALLAGVIVFSVLLLTAANVCYRIYLPKLVKNVISRGGGAAWNEAEAEKEDYVPKPSDEYYYGPCDSIDENVDYSFKSVAYTNEDPENDIDIIINYYQLEGNVPNREKLNETLKSAAMYYAEEFPKHSLYAQYGSSYKAYITSYVTYNDGERISIVQNESVTVDKEYHVDLYSINIDVKNGVTLDNSSLLDIDQDFAKEFKARSDKQNGSVEFLKEVSDGELCRAMNDSDSLIAFYTPLGMEIGVNYRSGGFVGWVTATYKDYESYQPSF